MRLTGIIVSFLFPLLAAQTVAAQANPAEEKGCTQCHRIAAEQPFEKRKAPDLFYAGEKFQAGWLQEFLTQPVVIRKAGFSGAPGFLKGEAATVAHPALSAEEAQAMSRFLLTLKVSDASAAKTEVEPLSKGQRVKAKILFERNFGCIACHEGINLAGKPRGGVSGPSLADAGNRLQAGWVLKWLQSPETYLEKSRMPRYDLDDATALTLTRYIASLKLAREAE